MDRDEPGEQAGTWWKEWFPQCFRWKPTRKDPGEMHAAGENVRHWIFDGIRAALHKHGLWPGKLDFYEAVDNLSDSFPLEVLRTYADEEIERLAIMVESGIPLKAAEKYLKIGKEKRV